METSETNNDPGPPVSTLGVSVCVGLVALVLGEQILMSVLTVATAGLLETYGLPTTSSPDTASGPVDLRSLLRSGDFVSKANTDSTVVPGEDVAVTGVFPTFGLRVTSSPDTAPGPVDLRSLRRSGGIAPEANIDSTVVPGEIVAVTGVLQTYGLPTTSSPDSASGSSVDLRSLLRSGGIAPEANIDSTVVPGVPGHVKNSCGDGQVRHVDGNCVTPEVTENVYLIRAPPGSLIGGPRPVVPPPRIEKNVFFIQIPEELTNQETIVVPPPQQRNIFYVLYKRPGRDHESVHAPRPQPSTQEVYFINYAEGENPTLPGGGDLLSALTTAYKRNVEVVGGNTEGARGSI